MRKAQTTGTFRVSFLTEVVPEPGDTVEGLTNFVTDLAREWLPDQFEFTVEYEDSNDGQFKVGYRSYDDTRGTT